MSKSGFKKFLLGLGIGCGIGLLCAAKSGKETRKDLKNKIVELENNIKNIDWEDLKDDISNKLVSLKENIESLDQDDIKRISKEKINDLRDKCKALKKSIKKKATPVILKLITEISEKIDDLDVDNDD